MHLYSPKSAYEHAEHGTPRICPNQGTDCWDHPPTSLLQTGFIRHHDIDDLLGTCKSTGLACFDSRNYSSRTWRRRENMGNDESGNPWGRSILRRWRRKMVHIAAAEPRKVMAPFSISTSLVSKKVAIRYLEPSSKVHLDSQMLQERWLFSRRVFCLAANDSSG